MEPEPFGLKEVNRRLPRSAGGRSREAALVNDLAVDDRGVPGERHRRAAPGYRIRGRDAATFPIALSGIRTTPQRPRRHALAAGFTGLALPRRRCRRR